MNPEPAHRRSFRSFKKYQQGHPKFPDTQDCRVSTQKGSIHKWGHALGGGGPKPWQFMTLFNPLQVQIYLIKTLVKNHLKSPENLNVPTTQITTNFPNNNRNPCQQFRKNQVSLSISYFHSKQTLSSTWTNQKTSEVIGQKSKNRETHGAESRKRGTHFMKMCARNIPAI